MIRVARIAGESFDFITKSELPKALILSNGFRELSLHVDDETARAIVEMELESEASHVSPDPVPATRNHDPQVVARTFDTRSPVVERQRSNPAIMELEDEQGLEPGEEYNDPTTGAESL
jgi:hypothetical protein